MGYSIMKKIMHLHAGLLALALSTQSSAELLDSKQVESGVLLPGYSTIIDTPFTGVAAFANGDGVEINTLVSGVPGKFRLDTRGASSANNSASIAVYLGDKKIGSSQFTGADASVHSIDFTLEHVPSNPSLTFKLETDNGSNDTYIDWYELHRVGDIPAPPPPPILPAQGAYDSGQYRNLFAELGYSHAEVQARVQATYDQLFHSPDTTNKALFIPAGEDMAYIWDVGNNDVRSEGMSYGMMMAVQMDRKDDFDKLWKWAHTYSLNKTGDMKGYFAWKVSTSGQIQDANPAPDGEEYFATALFFASHRWGDGNGIFNYSAQANALLDDMFNNGQTRYNNQGQLENFSLFDHDKKQIVFSPATPSDRNWTDPSYHLPAFYELWARWADNNNAFWAELAESSRAFLKTTVNANTGLSPDYAYFDGTPHGDFQNWKDTFQYDAWRTISNASMDYAWWQEDPWQVTYATTLQSFFKNEGINSYASLYELNGERYENNSDHSPGLVAMNAVASLASDQSTAWEFVQAFWDTPVPEGQWRYYDGSLYMLGMLAVSGNYKIYCPAGECDAIAPPSCEISNLCGGGNNQAPNAVSDQANTEQNTSVTLAVLNNDSDPENDPLSIVTHTQAANGSVTQTGSQLTYTPAHGFSGLDTFQYAISDGLLTRSATVSITVNSSSQPPVNPPASGTLIGRYQTETGNITPSFREPITQPYAGVILYGNGDSVAITTGQLAPGNYTFTLYGSSSNNTAAGISVYANNQKVGATDFSGSTRSEQTLSVTLTEAVSSITLTLETDTGQNDTLIDWVEVYSGSQISPPDTPPSTCSSVIIEAEDYTRFYDSTGGNAGNSYRDDDVDIQPANDSDGGYNVGWTASNEWLEYDLHNITAGDYSLNMRIASSPGNGRYTIDINGAEAVQPTHVNATGGWQAWQTLSHPKVTLTGGDNTLRVNIHSGGFNLNTIILTPTDYETANPAPPTLPPSNATELILQAEDYDNFHDTTSGNTGNAYRTDNVDIEDTTDTGGGYNVGWIESGEWLEYTAFFEAGTYQLNLRIASNSNNGAYSVSLDDNPVFTPLQVPNTNGWQSWQTQSAGTLAISEGVHTVRVNISGGYFNLNWLRLTPVQN